MSPSTNRDPSTPPALPAGYAQAWVAWSCGVPPSSIIKHLVAEGIPRQEIIQVLEQIAAWSIEQRIAQQIRAGVDDAAIRRDLIACGVDIETGRRLVGDARRVWTTMQARRRRQRRTALIRTAGTMGLVAVILVGGLRLIHRLRVMPETSTAPIVVVTLNQPLEARIARLPNAVVVAASLNVRSGPGPEYPLLLQLHAQEPLHVIGRMEEAGRYLVQLPDARLAWVRSDPDAVRLTMPRERLPQFVLEP